MDEISRFIQATFVFDVVATFPWAMLVFSAVSVGLVLFLARGSRTFPFADVLTGATLILIAMLYAALIGELSAKVAAENKSSYDLVYWIIPFYSAAIGSNFISNAFLGKREYVKWEKAHTNRFFEGCLLLLVAAALFYPLILLIVFSVIGCRVWKKKSNSATA